MFANLFSSGNNQRPPGTPSTPKPQPHIASPFFKPSTPRIRLEPAGSTPGGSIQYKKKSVDKEAKSSLLGTTGNLVNAIVGAGIVGIAYAVREAGLVAGTFMVVLCAVLTEKSLRLLIETAKHVDVPSYEMLMEAAFGSVGFYAVSVCMFIMSYGAMVSYLIVVKDTLPVILGFDPDDELMKRSVLTVSSMVIMFPLSCQRDVANLAKTSTLSVIFDIIMVFIVVIFAPASTSISNAGSLQNIISESTIYPRTFFVGLGVLSFAFVCQHSAFIIAGSLKNPTKQRWGTVTKCAMIICGILATSIGVIGYIAFGNDTTGNILNNFETVQDLQTRRAANIARALLCTTMFFVYPLESFVSRHVTVVTLFQGRRAHEGDDHSVLARWDRRMGLTMSLYLLALVPALIFPDVGVVLSVTGAVGGSALSYIGPGMVYLGIHGDEFLKIMRERFGYFVDGDDDENVCCSGSICQSIVYYLLLMPLWIAIAKMGNKGVVKFGEKEALKSPHLNRLGKIVHRRPSAANKYIQLQKANQRFYKHPIGAAIPPGKRPLRIDENGDEDDERLPMVTSTISSSFTSNTPLRSKTLQYGATTNSSAAVTGSTDRAIALAISTQQQQKTQVKVTNFEEDDTEEEDDPQEDLPSLIDFVIAISYIIFGIVALIAGVVSIFVGGGGGPA